MARGAMEMMIDEGTQFAWYDLCLLAHLYLDLNDLVYMGECNLSIRMTLLHIWAYDHVVLLRQVCMRFRRKVSHVCVYVLHDYFPSLVRKME